MAFAGGVLARSSGVTLLHESEYVAERLLNATSAEEVLEVIRTGEEAVPD